MVRDRPAVQPRRAAAFLPGPAGADQHAAQGGDGFGVQLQLLAGCGVGGKPVPDRLQPSVVAGVDLRHQFLTLYRLRPLGDVGAQQRQVAVGGGAGEEIQHPRLLQALEARQQVAVAALPCR